MNLLDTFPNKKSHLIFNNLLQEEGNITEKFADTQVSPTILSNIQTSIRQVYLSDVDAIRNLSNIAMSLTSSQLNAPGTITLTPGTQIINSNDLEVSGNKSLIISNKTGVIVSKKMNGPGSLNVEGNLSIGSQLLIQKTSLAQRNAIKDPSNGLLIFNGDTNVTLPQVYNGSTWKNLSTMPFTIIITGNIDLSNYNYPNILCIPELETTPSVTITLPLNPIDGQRIEVNNFSTSDQTISPNGKSIFRLQAVSTTSTLITSYTLIAGNSVNFIYNSNNNAWTMLKLKTIFTPYMRFPDITFPNKTDILWSGIPGTGSANSKWQTHYRGASLDFTTDNNEFIAGNILGTVSAKIYYGGSSNQGQSQFKLLLVQRLETASNYIAGPGTLANWPVVIEYIYSPVIATNDDKDWVYSMVCNGNTDTRKKLKKNTKYSIIFKIYTTNTGGFQLKLSTVDLKLVNDFVNDVTKYSVDV